MHRKSTFLITRFLLPVQLYSHCVNCFRPVVALRGVARSAVWTQVSYLSTTVDMEVPTITTNSVSTSADEEKPLSKSAQKKLARQKAYEEARPERLRRNKEKKLAKREAFKAAVASGEIDKPRRPKIVQEPSKLRILVDCSFDHLMLDKEIKSMTSQLTRCHSENKTAKHPCSLIITGWNAKIADRFHSVFKDQQRNWAGVQFLDHDYLDASTGQSAVPGVSKEDLVYLSADSENTIETIDETKCYIIGGIVDKNRHKNLCQGKAESQGIQTARLPIGNYIQMASRKVLTVNHVFEIMSRWLE